MKSYSYYAYACFRAYFENRATAGSAEASLANHDACEAALEGYDFNSLIILREIYTSDQILSVAVTKLRSMISGVKLPRSKKTLRPIEGSYNAHPG